MIDYGVIVFTFVSGGFSIAGYVRSVMNKGAIGLWEKTVFAVTLAFLCFVLFVPGNPIRNNVAAKTHFYSTEAKDGLLIQRGTLAFSGDGPIDVEFPTPYATLPRVQILNIHGYAPHGTPSVKHESTHSFRVVRYSHNQWSLIPEGFKEYKWIAEGVPREEKEMKP